jgi:nucleoside-diphosphate kinase
MKFKEERTVVIVKPDGVKRGLMGEIIRRIEQRGLKVIAMKLFAASTEDLAKHYPASPEYQKNLGGKTLATYAKYGMNAVAELGTDDTEKIGAMVQKWLLDYMTSGPAVKIVVQGLHAVEMVRKLAGQTMPSQAEMGTIRGDFSVDSAALANMQKRAVHNLVHASGSVEEAEQEIMLWFTSDEIHPYQRAEEDIMF